jgi:putative transposase
MKFVPWKDYNAIAKYLKLIYQPATKKRKLFPTNNSARKVVYLAVQSASGEWTMPTRNWNLH